jgi:nitroreductase
MDLIEAIKGRRSIRKFSPEPIPRELLARIIEDALWAPSGMNKQAWSVWVVTGRVKDDLVRLIGESGPHLLRRLEKLFGQKMIALTMSFFRTAGDAPAVILVSIPREDLTLTPEMSEFDRHEAEHDRLGAAQSASALMQNLCLLAYEAGLGTCWMNGPLFLQKEINELLGIEGEDLMAVIPIGYPIQEPPLPPRKPGKVRWIES